MLAAIIVNESGEEVYREEVKKPPLNGYVFKNGAYIKTLGSLACITDQKAEEKRKQKERYERENKEYLVVAQEAMAELAQAPQNAAPPDADYIQFVSDTTFLFAWKAGDVFEHREERWYGWASEGGSTMEKKFARIKKDSKIDFGVPALRGVLFRKIEVCYDRDQIKLWLISDINSMTPDIYITGIREVLNKNAHKNYQQHEAYD